ncbi:hypothetical protein [Streptomyces sp. NPDC048496]|uniref:hypothetical protein n=1 Tax=Streptomyces sp. NPDC048496 TaxID=3365558 RepID=UPI00371963D2
MAASQPVVTPPSSAALLLVATMAHGGEATVRKGLQDLAGPTRSVLTLLTYTDEAVVVLEA